MQLGGFNGDDSDQYTLGDDALACLRDIKRWLKLYDEKNNRMDVARCLGEANLVNGDLIPILSLWWNNGQNSRHMSRIALACCKLRGHRRGRREYLTIGSRVAGPYDLAVGDAQRDDR